MTCLLRFDFYQSLCDGNVEVRSRLATDLKRVLFCTVLRMQFKSVSKFLPVFVREHSLQVFCNQQYDWFVHRFLRHACMGRIL